MPLSALDAELMLDYVERSLDGKETDEDDDELLKEAKKAMAEQHPMAEDEGDAEDEEEEHPERIAKKAKKGKKAKKASDDDDEDENTKVKALEARVRQLTNELVMIKAKPMIETMLSAREQRGMPAEQLKQFANRISKSSLTQIRQRYNEDAVLFGGGQHNEQPQLVASLPVDKDGNSQTLEEMFA